MERVRESEDLRGSIDGDNKIDRSKNVASNAMQKMVEYAAQYRITDDQLEDRMDEMIDTCCRYFIHSRKRLMYSDLSNQPYSSPPSRRH